MYHLLAFKNVPKEEWFHHIVFGGGMGISGLYYNVGSITSLASFFIMGLPGGIDYALLAAVKQRLLRPGTEKQINARMNVWIRAPGLTITGYATYLAWKYSRVQVYHSASASLTGFLSVMNGLYYMERVVANAASTAGFRGS